MKVSELRKLIKPLVKDSVKEVLLEEGILSRMIQEAIIGVKSAELVLNEGTTVTKAKQNRLSEQEIERRQEQQKQQRRKLLDRIGKEKFGGVDLFEGTTPIQSTKAQSSPHGPLRDHDPGDAGVDITNLPGMGNWTKLV